MNTPIYSSVAFDLNFEPLHLAPIPTRAERKIAHDIWAAKAWASVRAGRPLNVVPIKRRKVAGK